MTPIKADLHIHSVLSPCGSLEMSPRAIVECALKLGLDLIAVTDHNAIANALIAGGIAQKRGLGYLYGIEAQSQEEVHLLAYFDRVEQLQRFYDRFEPLLPDQPNNPDFFGDQLVVDETDEIVGEEKRQLIASPAIGIDRLIDWIHEQGGVAVPAHVNAEQYGIYRNLGFLPPALDDSPLEVDYHTPVSQVLAIDPGVDCRRFICGSDAHYLVDIGRGQTHFMNEGVMGVALFDLPRSLYQPCLL